MSRNLKVVRPTKPVAGAKKTTPAPKKEEVIVKNAQVKPEDVKELQSFPLPEKFLIKMKESAKRLEEAQAEHNRDLGNLVEGFLSDKELKGGDNAKIVFDLQGKRIVEVE